MSTTFYVIMQKRTDGKVYAERSAKALSRKAKSIEKRNNHA